MKKKKENPEIIIKHIPWTEEEKEMAIKKLAAIWAHELGWVPKNSNKGKNNFNDSK